jgi:DNA-binding SARP family transcriptional activator
LPVAVHGTKTKALLSILALQPNHRLPRDELLNSVWPDCDPNLASHSLSNLLHDLKKSLGDAISGANPVLHTEGPDCVYRLNVEAGVGLDLTYFEGLLSKGDRQYQIGDYVSAITYYMRAISLYKGELCPPTTQHSTAVAVGSVHPATDSCFAIRREQAKGLYLTSLAQLAECQYALSDYASCLQTSFRLLSSDPCREDAHRMTMKCYVRKGQRSQAVQQYRLCKQIVDAELNTQPEPETIELFNQLLSDPASI